MKWKYVKGFQKFLETELKSKQDMDANFEEICEKFEDHALKASEAKMET